MGYIAKYPMLPTNGDVMLGIKRKTTPNLVVLNHGGGVQTQTLAEMIVLGEVEKPDAAIFADTGDEPKYVYAQVKYVQKRLASVGVPLLVVNNGSLHDDIYGGKRFAAMPLFTKQRHGKRGKKQKLDPDQSSMFELSEFEQEEPTEIVGFGMTAQIETVGKMRRQCTNEYKIVPIEREIRVMLLEMGLAKESRDGRIIVKKNVLVESWIGYTFDEVERIKPPTVPWQVFRYPLIERRMKKSDCIEWLSERGLPVPFSSHCRKCPLIGDERAIQMRDNDPEGYENRLQFDRDLRNGNLRIAATAKGELYIHDSCVPLDEVSLDPERESLLSCINHCMT